MQASTVATSHVHRGRIAGGLLKKRALMNLTISGCSPTEGEARGCSIEDTAER
jgi:hypothetical protein